MAVIPADLIVEILLRLPAVHLIPFRCVSKTWRNLIDSPDFIKSHLNLSKKAKSHSPMLFYKNPIVDLVDFDSVFYGSYYTNLKEVANRENFSVVGKCNGLLCICTTNSGVALWNPLTDDHVRVPPPIYQKLVSPSCHWGFGYDEFSDDFKVVTMGYSNSGSVVWIYSLKSRVWKSIGSFPYVIFPSPEQFGLFVNGALHWTVYPDSIAALDLGKLEYDLVPQPDHFNTYDGLSSKRFDLGVLDGCLCKTLYDINTCVFNLWLMKEYRVKESWIKLLEYAGCLSPMMPLTYLENDQKLFFFTEYHEIMWYEFKTNSVQCWSPNVGKSIQCWSPSVGKPVVYIPSLVRPSLLCRRSVLSGGDMAAQS